MRCSTPLRMLFVTLLASAALPLTREQGDAHPTAALGTPHGELAVRIVDPAGDPIPGRLTFVRADESPPDGFLELFPGTDAAPRELAVRKNVVYTLSGETRFTVPAGTWRVLASRGLEWSVDQTTLVIGAGETSEWTATLTHELDTTGWISGDFHLHTLTYSGHGDANPNERVISLIGEGVEFAVATDHNHNTDYGPVLADLGASSAMTAVVGNEISTPIGHFNAFPLDAARAPVDSSLRDANELFRLIRAEPNAFGLVPVIQLNHPRWDGIDYFTQTGLDPITGTSSQASFALDFDSLEVMNENAGWGYYDPDLDDVPTSGNLASVLKDWFLLLDRGHRGVAVGNSDSHTVHAAFAGYPRNYCRVEAAGPGAIDPAAVAGAIRAGQVFTTLGPFVELLVDGAPLGSEVVARDGAVTLSIRVQAASWVDVDRVKVVVGGEVVATLAVPDTRAPLRLEAERKLVLHDDSWIALLVEGDDPLHPIVPTRGRPIRPLAVVNPVRIDADGDGFWESPFARAKRTVAAATADKGDREVLSGLRAFEQGTQPRWEMLQVLAAIELERALPYARAGLASPAREVRLAAARAAETTRDETLVPALYQVLRMTRDDARLDLAVIAALTTQGIDGIPDLVLLHGERFGPAALQRAAGMLLPRLDSHVVSDWMGLGLFEAPAAGTIGKVALGPEEDGDTARTYRDRAGDEARWRPLTAGTGGRLDLSALAAPEAKAENAFAYAQTWLHADAEKSVVAALGTDDGGRVWVNGALVVDDPGRHGASPFQHVLSMDLQAGWNRVLFQVENGTGDFGLLLRVFDSNVRSARAPD